MLRWQGGVAAKPIRKKYLQVPANFILQLESRRTTAIAPSTRSRFGVNVLDPNFRTSLGKRKIYIADEDLPTELFDQAKEIISGPHSSSEMDDATAKELRRKAQSVATKAEDVIIRVLGTTLFPANGHGS